MQAGFWWRHRIVLVITALALVLWHLSPARATVNTSVFPAIKDAPIQQDAEIQNAGSAGQLEVLSQLGQRGRPDRNQRSLAQFDISSITASATIERAILRLYLQKSPGQRIYNVHRVTNSWLEGSGNGVDNSPAINGVTWIERQFGDNLWTGGGAWDWVAQGGDFVGAATDATLTPAASSWMMWNVVNDINAWYAGLAPNYGWLIKDSVESERAKQDGLFASRENGNPALVPALDVTYLRTGAAVSTTSAEAGSWGPIKLSFTNTGGPGADQAHQVSFTIPAGWQDIPVVAGGYAIAASSAKVWNVTGLPAASFGPQVVILTAATGADDIADGEKVEVTFSVRAPWLLGDPIWTFTTVGAAGGAHVPANWTVGVYGGALDFVPGGDMSLVPLTLSGADSTATGSLGTLEVRDARGTGSGWSLVLSASDFILTSNPTETISAAGFVVPTPPPVTVISTGNTVPTTTGGSLAGAGLAIMNAPAGSGAGHYRVVPDLQLLIPARAYTGTYTATLTETIIGI